MSSPSFEFNQRDELESAGTSARKAYRQQQGLDSSSMSLTVSTATDSTNSASIQTMRNISGYTPNDLADAMAGIEIDENLAISLLQKSLDNL